MNPQSLYKFNYIYAKIIWVQCGDQPRNSRMLSATDERKGRLGM